MRSKIPMNYATQKKYNSDLVPKDETILKGNSCRSQINKFNKNHDEETIKSIDIKGAIERIKKGIKYGK